MNTQKSSRSSFVFKLKPRPDALGPRNEADYQLIDIQSQAFGKQKAALLQTNVSLFQKLVTPILTSNLILEPNVLLGVFSFLTPFELCIASSVCKDWAFVANSDYVIFLKKKKEFFIFYFIFYFILFYFNIYILLII